MKSLFKAKIYHKRFLPKVNEFTYSGYYIKFSLNEMSKMKSAVFSLNKFNLFSFYESDHGYRDGSKLTTWAEDMLAQAGIVNFQGEIILQTFPRVLGYVFNPVSFLYCYENNELEAIICEVNNTFGETHCYTLIQRPNLVTNTCLKEFHVSPFYDIKGQYKFNFSSENQVQIQYSFDESLQLITAMSGSEIEWSDKNFLKLFIQYPFYTFIIVVLIHWQAFRLFVKKNKFYPKPTQKGAIS